MRNEYERKVQLSIDSPDIKQVKTKSTRSQQRSLYNIPETTVIARQEKSVEDSERKSIINTEPDEDPKEREIARQSEIDKLKYLNFCKTGKYSLKDILKVHKHDRSESEKFFLRQHLRLNVPFFSNYDGTVLNNICNHLQ